MAHDKHPVGPGAALTLNQVVAANIACYRQEAGLTQRELGERIGWKTLAVSEAERSRDGRTHREFDAAELGAFAWALGVPLVALFLPPAGDAGARYAAGPASLDAAGLMGMLVMPDSDDDTPAMTAYRQRFNAAAAAWLDPQWAATAARWLGGGTAPGARAVAAARLRDMAAAARGLYYELDQAAGAVEGEAP
jgi:hypothetical protein